MGEMSISFRSGISQADIDVYFKRLSECSMHQIRRAIQEIIDKDDYFPKLSKIKTLAKSFLREPNPVPMDVHLIEEQTFSNDMPKTKEDFFKAMDDLVGKVSI